MRNIIPYNQTFRRNNEFIFTTRVKMNFNYDDSLKSFSYSCIYASTKTHRAANNIDCWFFFFCSNIVVYILFILLTLSVRHFTVILFPHRCVKTILLKFTNSFIHSFRYSPLLLNIILLIDSIQNKSKL